MCAGASRLHGPYNARVPAYARTLAAQGGGRRAVRRVARLGVDRRRRPVALRARAGRRGLAAGGVARGESPRANRGTPDPRHARSSRLSLLARQRRGARPAAGARARTGERPCALLPAARARRGLGTDGPLACAGAIPGVDAQRTRAASKPSASVRRRRDRSSSTTRRDASRSAAASRRRAATRATAQERLSLVALAGRAARSRPTRTPVFGCAFDDATRTESRR